MIFDTIVLGSVLCPSPFTTASGAAASQLFQKFFFSLIFHDIEYDRIGLCALPFTHYDSKQGSGVTVFAKIFWDTKSRTGLYPSGFDYLRYIASIKGLSQVAARKKVDLVLRQVGMEKSKRIKMKKLSGGMKRRVGIAQAILNDPQILILDEPTAGLDPNERIRFRNLISELSQNRIVLLSTHIVSDIESVASRVFFMKDGEITLSGTVEEILGTVPAKVWICEMTPEEADRIQKQYSVSNRRLHQGSVELRVITEERPVENAREENLTLEDLFLYVFGEKGDDTNGEI